MKQETIDERARKMLNIGKGKLKKCKTTEGRKSLRKTNKYFREVIQIGRKYR